MGGMEQRRRGSPELAGGEVSIQVALLTAIASEVFHDCDTTICRTE